MTDFILFIGIALIVLAGIGMIVILVVDMWMETNNKEIDILKLLTDKFHKSIY